MTTDLPLNPSEVHIQSVKILTKKLETSTMREICGVKNGPQPPYCTQDHTSDASMVYYDEGMMISRMIGAVHIVTAYRGQGISFLGSKEQHSQVSTELWSTDSGVAHQLFG